MRKKKPLPILENVEITGFAAEGKAVARVNDMVVFVPYAAKYCFLKVINEFIGHYFFRQQQLASLLCNSPMLTEEQLQSIQSPVLLIAGTRDLIKVSHSRRMAQMIPKAQLLLIKRATHTSMFGRKQLYLKIIKDFLENMS